MDCFKSVAESPKVNACLNDLVSKTTFLASQLERVQVEFDAKLSVLAKSHAESLHKHTELSAKHADLSVKHAELSVKHADLNVKHEELSSRQTVSASIHSDLCFQHQDLTRKYSSLVSLYEELRKKLVTHDVLFEETERIKSLASHLKDNLHVTHDMIDNLSVIAKDFSSSYFDAIETGALHGSPEILSTTTKPLLLLPPTKCTIQVGERPLIHVLNPGSKTVELEMVHKEELLLKLDVSPLEGLTFHVDILKTDKDFSAVTSWGIC